MTRYRTTHKPKTEKKRSLLPLWLSLAGLVLLAIAVLALRSGGAQSKAEIEVQGSPSIKVDKETIDHGDVKLGTVITDVVQVTNVGDQTLRFSEPPSVEVLEGC